MKQLLGLLGLLSIVASAVPASAASPGIAYDSVTKFAMGNDAASTQPGTFETDFKTASQPVQQQPAGGGLLGGLNAAMTQGLAMANMMKSGLAERHFIAGQRERVDNVAAQTATILDCQARTLATLDLKNKTYKIVSLDAPQQQVAARGPAAAPQAVATDDGSKIAMSLTNQALGPRQIGPDTADGYRSDMSMTITRPGSQSVTSQMTTTEYIVKLSDYTLTCGGVASNVSGPAAAAMSQYAMAHRAMAMNNPRFTVTSSGPPLPQGRFSVFTAITMGGSPGASGNGGPPGGFASIIERGHERAITDDDPIFTIPPGFTKTN
ncbi:MAG: hypothetical protein ABSH03_01530 [Candidatus Lustribacter sp.]|jgi:hypothetical protein